MKKLMLALAALVLLTAKSAFAEEQQPVRKFQIAPNLGLFIPTGDQRDVLDVAFLMGLTLSYDVNPNLALVGSFDRYFTSFAVGDELEFFQYDLGVQGQYAFDVGAGVTLKPFVGAGLGARTYDDDLDVGSQTDVAGYVALGASMELRNSVTGLTVRDYVTEYDGVGGDEESSTRNDMAVFVSVGLRF